MTKNLPIIYGEKCYPLCGWEANQHKIETVHNRAYNALERYLCDSDLMDDEYEDYEAVEKWFEETEVVHSMFNNHIVGGVVYLPFPWYNVAKEMLASY